MVESSTSRFQMVGARAAILESPIAELIEQEIEAIEDALARFPDLAFDLSKALVESVCKTVLADIGQPADPKWDAPRPAERDDKSPELIAPQSSQSGEGTRLSREHDTRHAPDNSRTVRTPSRLWHGIPRSRRLLHALGPSSSNAGCSGGGYYRVVLYRIHRDALSRSPGARVYYEDYDEFNDALTATMS